MKGSAALILTTLLCAGCGDDGAPHDPEDLRTRFDVQLGVFDADTSTFAELSDAEHVEIIVGFQGLVFIDLALLTDAPIGARFQAVSEVDFDDDELDFTFQDNYVFFEDRAGVKIAPSFRVAFDIPVDRIDGEEIELHVVLTDDTWRADLRRRFRIADLDGCLHNPDGGEPICD